MSTELETEVMEQTTQVTREFLILNKKEAILLDIKDVIDNNVSNPGNNWIDFYPFEDKAFERLHLTKNNEIPESNLLYYSVMEELGPELDVRLQWEISDNTEISGKRVYFKATSL